MLKELIEQGLRRAAAPAPRTGASAFSSPRRTGTSWRSGSPSCRPGVSCGRSPTARPGCKAAAGRFLFAMIDPADRPRVAAIARRARSWKERDRRHDATRRESRDRRPRAACARRRRRPPPAPAPGALPRRARLSRHDRGERRRGPRQERGARLRRHRARRDDAGRDRLRLRPAPAHAARRCRS